MLKSITSVNNVKLQINQNIYLSYMFALFPNLQRKNLEENLIFHEKTLII